MTKTTFTAPSLAVAFFASAGGEAFLRAALDLRAATAGIDGEPDISNDIVIEIGAAQNAFDAVTNLLAEAGVQVVIAPGGADHGEAPALQAVVDGLFESDDPETANYDGAGQFAPFRIFIPNAQAYLRGDYDTRAEAQAEADKINGGDYTPPA